MTADFSERVADLFARAVELPPAERAAFLAAACGGASELRREVEGLLAADVEVESGIATPLWPSWSSEPGDGLAGAPRRVGAYRLVRRLGEGGMSDVFLGVRDDGELHQRVAVKLIRRELLSAEMVDRFATERQILAGLSHPSIARLLDAGRTAEGVPYFVMEYVEGEPIDLYCDRHRLPVAERLRIFRQVCAAVQSAHQNLVVHRDIKPSNILVTAEGVPKLLDFGIAKLLNPELSARGAEPTSSSRRLLTPECASPEQILGKPITPASDVYSLGVLLFRVLTGAEPYRLGDRPAAEVERLVLTSEPEPPSAVVRRALRTAGSEPARLRSTQPRALVRALAGDLDAITARALRKEPQNRYASAGQLAEDLDRHLAGLPVLASVDPLTSWPRLRRLRPRRLAAVAVFALALGGAGGGLVYQAARLADSRAEALRERRRAEEVTSSLARLLEEAARVSPPLRGRSRELIDRVAARIDRDLAGQPETQADLTMAVGGAYARLGLLEETATAFQRALAIRERLFGAEHERVAESLVQLAGVDARLWQLDDAQALYARSLAIRRKLHRGDSLEVSESLLGLGRVLLTDVHPARAEPLLLEALAIRRKVLGEGDARVGEVLTDLGHAVDELGSPSAASLLFLRASKILRRSSGSESWELAASLVDEAATRFDLGRQDGGALLREAAAIERRLCRDEVASVPAALLNFAAAARRGSPEALAYGQPIVLPPGRCATPILPVPRLYFLLDELGQGLTELGSGSAALSMLEESGHRHRSWPPAIRLQPDTSRADGPCVPDGGIAEASKQRCCSGLIAAGTTVCANPDDWETTWRSCRHVCGSRLVDGCVPSGGVTDTLGLTDCCSQRAVSGSLRCLNPADQGTSWRTCVHLCS